MDEVYGYKVFRLKRNGELGPLFINRQQDVPKGVWLTAEDHPTPGYAHRPGWHATEEMHAPHLKMHLASGEVRVWVRVLLRGVKRYQRPDAQGREWILARELKVLEVLT